MALKLAPAREIKKRHKLIEPWTKHADWWLRQAAFIAFSGLQKDDSDYVKILPTLLDVATKEYHTMPREAMMQHFHQALNEKKPDSKAGKLILAGLKKATTTSEIKSGVRAAEGAYNVIQAVKVCLQNDPTLAAPLATALRLRFSDLQTGDIVNIVGAPGSHPGGEPFGFFTMLEKLDPKPPPV